MNFKDYLSKAIFEEDPVKAQVPQQVLGPSSIAMMSTPVPTYTPVSKVDLDNSSVVGNPLYEALKNKTSFEETPIGKQVADHLAPLEGLPLSESQKMSAVLKAGVKEGLTAQKIVDTLSGLLQKLQIEQDAFTHSYVDSASSNLQSIKDAIQREADKVKDLEAQITASRELQSKMSSELITKQTELQSHQAQFQAAIQTRTNELQNSIQHYSEILKG